MTREEALTEIKERVHVTEYVDSSYVDCVDIEALRMAIKALERPDNQTNLCDSCDYSYPDCPSKTDDVIFGNGIGNDNICACNKYKPSAHPEIIYCKKCKHWTETCGNEQWGLGDCDVFEKHLVMCNGYCAWAERREE